MSKLKSADLNEGSDHSSVSTVDSETQKVEELFVKSMFIKDLYDASHIKKPKQLSFRSIDEVEIDIKHEQDDISDDGHISDIEYEDENDDRKSQRTQESLSSSDDSSDGYNSEDEDNQLGSYIYQFQDEFIICEIVLSRYDKKVYKALRRSNNESVIISITNFDKHYHNKVPREVRVFRQLKNQPNICECLGWCPINDDTYAILMKYYNHVDPITTTFGNLYYIMLYMKGLLNGLSCMAKLGIAHRDVAMQNVLWDPIKEESIIIDMDLAAFNRKKGFYKDIGRENYYAPEKIKILKEIEDLSESNEKGILKPKCYSYNHRADVYSAGVILYMLLHELKHSPSRATIKKFVSKAQKKKLYKKHVEIDLLLKMLHSNPESRITAENALKHEFFKIEPNEEYMDTRDALCQCTPDVSVYDDDEKSGREEDDDEKSNDDELLTIE